MNTAKARYASVDDYIASFPKPVQERMQELRRVIHAAAPGVEEKISYQMAGFDLHGYLIYFAGAKTHIGVYAASSAIPAYPELGSYAGPKGTLRFPHNQPFPLELIRKAVMFRVKENRKKAAQ